MPCNKPVKAWRDSDGVRFVGRKEMSNLALPCGQCWGCRLERSRQWAVRCMHEAKMHEHNCFLTLTYDDERLPGRYWTGLYRQDGTKAYAGTLHYRDVQLFFKRLRRKVERQSQKTSPPAPFGGARAGGEVKSNLAPHLAQQAFNGATIAPASLSRSPQLRFYLAGEYGEQYLRPHWHACVFGIDFSDKVYLGTTASGSKLYESATLQALWPYGFSSLGEVTFESAAYVARYVMKKVNGKQQKEHYEKIDMDTGEIIRIRPEFNNMSRAEGIGLSFFKKYYSDMYPEGRVIVRGHPSKTPRYYDKKFKERDPVAWEALEYDRHIYAMQHLDDHRPQRLAAREKITVAKVNMLTRKL